MDLYFKGRLKKDHRETKSRLQHLMSDFVTFKMNLSLPLERMIFIVCDCHYIMDSTSSFKEEHISIWFISFNKSIFFLQLSFHKKIMLSTLRRSHKENDEFGFCLVENSISRIKLVLVSNTRTCLYIGVLINGTCWLSWSERLRSFSDQKLLSVYRFGWSGSWLLFILSFLPPVSIWGRREVKSPLMRLLMVTGFFKRA